jgi:(2Fe-2S) ferredoxin
VARRYVLVCRGPTCKSQGSTEVREALRKAIAESGQTDVVVLPYTCFDLCGRGPNAVIYPDGEWFEALGPGDVPDLVEHILGRASATHLLAKVDRRHAEECYQIFDEVIPELEAEAEREAAPRRRVWPSFFKILGRKVEKV